MASIPGSVTVTGFIAPTDTTDTYAVIDPLYGIDGMRSVASTTARNAITTQRRRAGMIVYTQSDNNYWKLQPSPWTGADSDWIVLALSGTQGPQGVPGSGTQGLQGSQGNSGFQGFIGYQGIMGLQGTTGFQGYQGYQGYQGLIGVASTVPGPQGNQGNTGFQGATSLGPQGSASTVPGPQGFQGYQGAGYQGVQGTSGVGSATYVFTQSTPLSTWNIVHNLGKYPSVGIFDNAMTEVFGDITYINAGNLTLSFSIVLAGTAYLN